jgi:hypothetical protein
MGGVTVIYANQGGPVPPVPFATLTMGALVGIGQEHEYGWGTDPGKPAYVPRKMAGDRRLTCSVQVFGPGALDYARAAAQGLAKQTVRDVLDASGLAPVAGVPEVRDLSELLATSFEDRAQFDAEFFLGDTYTDSVPVIESIAGTETIKNPNGTTRSTIPFYTADGP